MPASKARSARRRAGTARARTRPAPTHAAPPPDLTSARTPWKRRNDAIAHMLVFHRVIASPDALTARNLEDLIARFQEQAGLMVDGDIGPETRWALQSGWVRQTQKLLWVRAEADVVPGIEGFDHLVLREDAAARYQALRADVTGQGGVITSAGGRRALSTGAGPGRSAKSMHYAGLAFDLALTSGFFKPETDPFVVTRGEDGYWEVFCRASGGAQRTLRAVHWAGWNAGVDLQKTVRGTFLSFTELCRKHGFHPIRPRKSFRRPTSRQYISAEWWHFQANDLLVPEWSQLGIELLKIEGYTATSIEAENASVWSHRKATFGIDWA